MRRRKTKAWRIYKLYKGNKIQRIGKAPCLTNKPASDSYLEKRYGKSSWWDSYTTGSCFTSEERAYDEERKQLDRYRWSHKGKLPPHNKVRGGGGPRRRRTKKKK